MVCVCAAQADLLKLLKPKPCPNNPITTFSTPLLSIINNDVPINFTSVTYSHRSSRRRIYNNNNYYIRPPSAIINNNSNSSYSSLITVADDDVSYDNIPPTLRDLCIGHVPDDILTRMEEVGFVMPTDVQKEALPVLLSGCDCILHAQTGSGKTLAYLLAIYSVINSGKSVQALIVVPTRELGMQVTKVARLLTGSVMTLLDGGSLTRQKSWLKAEPPTIVVATLCSLCRMLEKRSLKLESLKVLVVDEVCSKDERLQILRTLLDSDAPQSAIIFASEQSEKSKMLGETPPTTLLIEYLKTLNTSCFDILLLEEDMNINSRAASLSEMRRGRFLLVATDMASRGVDLPETTHVYNFDLPKCAVDYLHRAGRTGRRPFSDKICHVSSIITAKGLFVLQRYENELKFCCEEMFV